ncbi:MAG: hypothetical protein R3284_11105 [Rubricoccaceae bacterium]|nr:hypothetical protein [Rubricoccaceae bacterium]
MNLRLADELALIVYVPWLHGVEIGVPKKEHESAVDDLSGSTGNLSCTDMPKAHQSPKAGMYFSGLRSNALLAFSETK